MEIPVFALGIAFSYPAPGEGVKFLQETMIISMKWPQPIFQPARAKAHGLFLCCVVPFQRVPEGFLYFSLHLFILHEQCKMETTLQKLHRWLNV